MFAKWAVIAALALTQAVGAYAYPTKPARFIVPFPPGGGADLVGRVVGQKLGELFKAMSKTEIVHVPYKGAVPALNDIMSGRMHLMFVVPATAMPHVNAGRVRALGISSAKRSPLAPDIPTVSESGVAGFEGTTWYGVVVPAKTPRDVVAKLNRDVRHVLQQPDIRERFTAQNVEVVTSTPEEFAQFIRSEMVKWRQVAGAAGIRVE